MHLFGIHPWGSALDEPPTMVDTPVGRACDWCLELIAAGDSGMVMPLIQPDGEATTSVQHRECHLRQIVGSVGHQECTCSCFGGDREDPPEMTRRQAAHAAVELFYGR
jgi:hypothetical protein